MNSINEWRDHIHKRLVELLHSPQLLRYSSDTTHTADQAKRLVGNILDSLEKPLPAAIDPQVLTKKVLDFTLGFGILEDFLKNDEISEIMVNGARHIYIERHGQIEKINQSFNDNQEVMALIERIVSPLGRRIDEGVPLVDARLPDGSRVNAIIPPLALTGPCMTIRKFKPLPFKPEEMIANQTISAAFSQFLEACVSGRLNIVISGGTGSGKTTLLNFLAHFIPAKERIITIEDAAELRLPQEHVVSLESRPANIEGSGQIPIRALVRNALRMRPDRIVVGECRGGEALDMLQAMNTGHDGSLTTGHANSPRDMLLRLETMVLMSGVDLPVRAIREQIASAIDLIIHLERLSDGHRKVTRVLEICGMEGEVITTQDLFHLELGKHKALRPTGMIPLFLETLRNRNATIPPSLFQTDRLS